MIDNIIEFVSVCCVSEDNRGRIWLTRIADIENKQLNVPNKSNRSTNKFENRDRLYWNEGPSQDGTIGVWRWTACPNLNDSEKDYVKSFFIADLCPVRVVVVQNVQSMQALIDLLKKGSVCSTPYICDTLFCFDDREGRVNGVLLRYDDFTVQNTYVTINDSIYYCPCYSLKITDIYNWNDKNLCLLKRLDLGDPDDYISFGNNVELIRSTISSRMTWPHFKEYIGKTKAEWRDCKVLFDLACTDSLYEEVAIKLGCPLKIAQKDVSEFIKRAADCISEGDIDSDVLAQIAMNNDGLRTQCEAAVEEQWKSAHVTEIVEAQAETDRIKQESENIVNKSKAQFDQIEEDKKVAEKDRQTILGEIADAQSKLDQLRKEIEEYEALGTNTVQAVRDKIGAAQQDMAGFIAELSPFMPQRAMQNSESCVLKPTNRWTFTSGSTYDEEEDIESCSDWEDTRLLLQDNLQLAGVGEQWSEMLSAFLYSAYINSMPILLAGPNAQAIASALSLTVRGKTLDLLKCCGDQNSDVVSEYEKSELAAVENPFHPDWITYLPQMNSNGFTLWLHPFAEDLQIEPRSLYNYAFPIFTECFADQTPSVEKMFAGQKKEQYTEFQPDPNYRGKLGQIKKLGISRLVLNRIQKVLADAKCMRTVSDVSMEYLFAMLPLFVLSGKQETLAELLEDEKNLTAEVRTEIKRYIEE